MAASYTFEDLSGSSIPITGDNPYQDLIEACNDDPSQIQTRYNNQRINRNTQKRSELLSPNFPGVNIDAILARLEDPSLEPGFQDPRHCLVFWARPPKAVRDLISQIQHRLLKSCPHLWIMPAESLHITALEIAHSLTSDEIESLVQQISPHAQEITDYTYAHRARLVRPLLNYDTQSLALQWLPAAVEDEEGETYTYHHLRRDLFSLVQNTAGTKVGSRYVTPSAHLTICRFITTRDFARREDGDGGEGGVDHAKVKEFVKVIDEINEWLKAEYWPSSPLPGDEGDDSDDGVEAMIKPGGEWIVGQEKGLECRRGTLWYGGGERVCLGKGF